MAVETVSYFSGSQAKFLFKGSWLVSAQFKSLSNGSNPANLASVESQCLLCRLLVSLCVYICQTKLTGKLISCYKLLERKRPAIWVHLPSGSSSIPWGPQRNFLIIIYISFFKPALFLFLLNQTDFRNVDTTVRIQYLKKTSYLFLFRYSYLFLLLFHKASWPRADCRNILFCKGGTNCSPFGKLPTIYA